MRVLLAAKCPPNGTRKIGGVQSWCNTVGDELVKRGHRVSFWGPGQVTPLGGFDLGFIANVGDTERASHWCRKSIFVCHGIIPAEKPLAGIVVFTSEGVRDHWQGDGPVIRQPIDLDFWSPGETHEPKYLTRFSYRNGLTFVPTIAKNLHLEFTHLKNADPKGARRVLRQSACVLATGRASLEAMACGVPVVLCDHRNSYQGPLMDLNVQAAMKQNYSGRGGIEPTPNSVLDAVTEAIRGSCSRAHVKRHHNVVNIVNKLLEAAE